MSGHTTRLAGLLAAVFAGDHCRLSQLLASASPDDLAGNVPGQLLQTGLQPLLGSEPLSLFHAAVLRGDGGAVRLLHAAGVPLASANALGVRWSGRQMTALGLAAFMGRTSALDALLAAGMAPDAPSLDERTQPGRQLSTLALLVETQSHGHVDSMVRSLLAAGADVTAVSLAALEGGALASPTLGRLLLGALQQASEAGRFPAERWQDEADAAVLFSAIGAADAAGSLEHFAGQLLVGGAPESLAARRRLASLADATLRTAFTMDPGHTVLSLASQAACTDVRPMSATAVLLRAADLPGLVRSAVAAGSPAALRALLSYGCFEFPGDGPVFRIPTRVVWDFASGGPVLGGSTAYQCPILMALQCRLAKAS